MEVYRISLEVYCISLEVYRISLEVYRISLEVYRISLKDYYPTSALSSFLHVHHHQHCNKSPKRSGCFVCI